MLSIGVCLISQSHNFLFVLKDFKLQDSQLVLSDDGTYPAEHVMHSATGNTEPFNALVTRNIIYCTYFEIGNTKNI